MKTSAPEQKGVPKLTPFHLSRLDGNITEIDGVAATWTGIWVYEVPLGTGIILQAGDTFAAYLEDTSPAQVGAYDCYVKIEVQDPSGLSMLSVFGPSLYNQVKEFSDRNKLARLGVSEPVKVYPRQKIVISVKDAVAIDASDSYFDLFTSKVAIAL